MVVLDGLEKLVAYSELNLEEITKDVREKVQPYGILDVEIQLSEGKPLLEISANFNKYTYMFKYDGYPSVDEIIHLLIFNISSRTKYYSTTVDDYYQKEYVSTYNEVRNYYRTIDSSYYDLNDLNDSSSLVSYEFREIT